MRFRIDHDDYSDELLARDPFYQEFLRPIGYFWHANVALTARYGETVELSLKRHLKAGAYEHADAGMLDACVAGIAGGGAHRQGHARRRDARHGAAHAQPWPSGLRDRRLGEGAFRPDGERRGSGMSGVRRRAAARREPIALRSQPSIAPSMPSSPHSAAPHWSPLPASNGRRYFLQVVPVPGGARDVFLSAAALAVLIDIDSNRSGIRLEATAIRAAFALTEREAEVELPRHGTGPAHHC